MNETIGSKNGANDRKRQKIIEQKAKADQEEEEIRKLENQVKGRQFWLLLGALPIALTYESFRALFGKARDNKDTDEENSKWRIKEYDSTHTMYPTGRNINYPEGNNDIKKQSRLSPGRETYIQEPTKDSEITMVKAIDANHTDFTQESKIAETPDYNHTDQKEIIKGGIAEPRAITSMVTAYEIPTVVSDNSESVIQVPNNTVENMPYPRNIGLIGAGEQIEAIPDSYSKPKQLEKLTSRKIVEEYENQLKEIRFELRKLIIEYNVLNDGVDELSNSDEADLMLDRLSQLIAKLEELKDKINLDNIGQYDENYIYVLIGEYLGEFESGNALDEVKDSPLYIDIAAKIGEIDHEKDKLEKRVNEKKEDLARAEKDFDELKERAFAIEKINKEMIAFQEEQARLLEEIKIKVANAVTTTERLQVETRAMNMQSRRLMRLLALPLMIPGLKSAKAMALSAATYLYFMQNLLTPQQELKTYSVTTVEDYTNDIKSQMTEIENAQELISRTTHKIDHYINEIETKFKEYRDQIPEYDELLDNLRSIKNNLGEKEYEMVKIKEEQQLALTDNKNKILQLENKAA